MAEYLQTPVYCFLPSETRLKQVCGQIGVLWFVSCLCREQTERPIPKFPNSHESPIHRRWAVSVKIIIWLLEFGGIAVFLQPKREIEFTIRKKNLLRSFLGAGVKCTRMSPPPRWARVEGFEGACGCLGVHEAEMVENR